MNERTSNEKLEQGPNKTDSVVSAHGRACATGGKTNAPGPLPPTHSPHPLAEQRVLEQYHDQHFLALSSFRKGYCGVHLTAIYSSI